MHILRIISCSFCIIIPSSALHAQEHFRPFGIPFNEQFADGFDPSTGMTLDGDFVQNPPNPNPYIADYAYLRSARDKSFICTVTGFIGENEPAAVSIRDALIGKYGDPVISDSDSFYFFEEIDFEVLLMRASDGHWGTLFRSTLEVCEDPPGPDASVGL